MEDQFCAAVENGGVEEVKRLLKLGINTNVLWKGKSALSIAASHGDILMMEVLLSTSLKEVRETKSEQKHKPNKVKRKRERATGNNGYYVMVHGGESTPCTTFEANQDENRNHPFSSSIPEELMTPEGMDKLEWDMELEEVEPNEQEKEDVWCNQYRWYAQILARTGQHTRYEQSPSSFCDINMQDNCGRCAIHYAADSGQLAAVKFLLSSGCKVDVGDVDNLTPLHLAANRGSSSIVETLLCHGALVDPKSTDKMTPLHYASSRGNKGVVSLLIKRGANLDALDSGDRTPLALAASRGFYDTVRFLVEAGAKTNIEDVKGVTALCEAVWQKDVSLTRLLLDFGAKLTPTPYLLHYAILHRHIEMVEVLLNAGAIVNIRDERGSTPLIVAVTTSQPEIIRLLIKKGACVDFCGGVSWKSPLMVAVERKCNPTDLQVINELIEGGADIDKPCWGVTAVISAIHFDKVDATIMLLAHGASIVAADEAVTEDLIYYARRFETGIYSVRAIVLVGYDIWRNCPDIEFDKQAVEKAVIEVAHGTASIHSWLLALKFNPLRLSELARIAVRRLRPKKNITMTKYVSSLGLPKVLVQYLMLSDVKAIPGLNMGIYPQL